MSRRSKGSQRTIQRDIELLERFFGDFTWQWADGGTFAAQRLVAGLRKRTAKLRTQVEWQRAAVREFLDAWMDKTDHPNGESSSYSMDAAERLERAVAALKRIAEADDA